MSFKNYQRSLNIVLKCDKAFTFILWVSVCKNQATIGLIYSLIESKDYKQSFKFLKILEYKNRVLRCFRF